MIDDRPPTDDATHERPFEPVWRPKQEAEVVGSIWINAGLGVIACFAAEATAFGVFQGSGRLSIGTVVAVVVGLVLAAAAFVSLYLRRTGFFAGALVALGLSVLCPVVTVVALCGNMKL